MNDRLAALISAGVLHIEEDDVPFFHQLGKLYPVRDSGICWELLPSARSDFSTHYKKSGRDFDRIRDFLHKFQDAALLHSESICLVLSDLGSAPAIRVRFSSIVEDVSLFFDGPSGIYILTESFEWCFACTFEDDLHYARSPKIAR